jgi:hypothetical protein
MLKNISLTSRYAVALGSLLILMTGVLFQASRCKPIFFPNHTLLKTEWDQNHCVPFRLGSPGNIYYPTWRSSPLVVTGRKGDITPSFHVALKTGAFQHATVICMVDRLIVPNPPRIMFNINSNPVAAMQITRQLHPYASYVSEFPLDFEPRAGQPAIFQVVNHGGDWFGGIFLVPHQALRKFFILFLLPIACAGLAAAYSLCYTRPRSGGLLLLSIGTAFFYYLNFHFNFLPTAEAFFSDARELFDAIHRGEFTGDMHKHPLFMLVVHTLYNTLASLHSKPLKAASIVFSFISAANVLLAAAFIRHLIKARAAALAAFLVYTFAFVTLTYSSFFETYVLTASLTTAAMLAALRFRQTGQRRHQALGITLTGLLPLASWQMLAFVPFLLFWQTAHLPGWRKKLIPALLAILIGCVTYAAILEIYGKYQRPADRDTAKALQTTHSNYASVSHFNRKIFLDVTRDTLFNVFTNAGHPLLIQTLTPREIHIINGLQCTTCLAVIGLMLTAGWGVIRRKTMRSPLAVLFGGTLLLYIAFHWYFNPKEMMLYLMPAFLPLLACLVVPSTYGTKTTLTGWLLGCLLVAELAMGGFTMYLGSKGLFQRPPDGKAIDCPVVELNVR